MPAGSEKPEIYRNRSVAGGVNTFPHPLDINDDQAVDLTNIDIATPGVRKIRAGTSLVATGMTFGPPLLITPFTPSSFSQELLAISPGAAYPTAAHQRLWKWTGSGMWQLVGTLTGFTSATMPVDATVGLDLNATNGPGVIRFTTKDASSLGYYYNGSALVSGVASPSAGMFPSAYMLNRAFGGGRAAGDRAKVYFSDVASYCATGWSSTNSIRMGGGDRQEVVALKPYRGQQLVVFMADRIEYLTIADGSLDTSGSTPFTSWKRGVIDTKIGCGSRRSVAVSGEDLIFMDQYGDVRSLARTIQDNDQGAKTLPISTPIKSWIDRINPVALDAVVAESFDRYYFIGLPIDSATTPSHTFRLDRVTGAWAGPWIGKWQPRCMTVATLDAAASTADRNPVLYIAGTATAQGEVYRTGSGTTDDGSAIVYQETSKRFYAGQIEAQKMFRRLRDYFNPTGTATMLVEARKDGGAWQTLGYQSLAGDLPALPNALPLTLGGEGLIESVFTLENFELPRDMQFRHTCTATVDVQHLGYSVQYQREDIPWDLKP